MNDVELGLLMLANTEKLGQAVREESTRLLLDSGSRQQVVSALTTGQIEELPGWKEQPAASFAIKSGTSEARANEVFRQCGLIGAQLLFRGSPDYPVQLLDLESPPLVLYVRGDSAALKGGSGWIAMVGTRQPTELGVRFARRTAGELAAAGFKVVSGLALGTDAAVHTGALDEGGCTIAVLASGVDELTPRSNASLGRRILDSGAVVSEQPPGTRVGPWSFPDRNRIIAALAQHVIILEAGIGSGTTITAEAALELERQVWVMPGRPGDQSTAGCLHLLDYERARIFHGSHSVIDTYPHLEGKRAVTGLGAELVELAHLVAAHLPCRLDQLPGLLGVSDKVPVLLGGLNLLKLHRILHEDATGQLSLVGELPRRQPVR